MRLGRPERGAAHVVWATRFAPGPALRGGDGVYTEGLIRSLARIVPVRVLCYEQAGAAPPEIAGVQWHLLPRSPRPAWRSMLSPLPNIAFQFADRGYARALREHAAGARAVFLDHLAMAWCAWELGGVAAGGPPSVLVTHNYEAGLRAAIPQHVADPLRRLALTLDQFKAARLERRALQRVAAATTITDADGEAFRREHRVMPLLCVAPGYDGHVVARRRIDAAVPPQVVLLGTTTAFHKRLVLEAALRGLRALPAEAGLSVEVIGEVEPALCAAAEAAMPFLRFRGYVADITPSLATARAAILPDMVGGGFKLRALTLAFHRVPMLAVAGALSGMGLVAGRHFLEFPDIAALVAALPVVLRDVERLDGLQQAAFQACRERYDWADRGLELLSFALRIRQPEAWRRAGSVALRAGRPPVIGDRP